jgi:AraC-like DNA-binding protein
MLRGLDAAAGWQREGKLIDLSLGGACLELAEAPAEGTALEPLIAIAHRESLEPSAGSQSMLARLSELMFIEVVRRYLSTLPSETTGWLAGLRDEIVGRSLGVLHDRPIHAWSLEELAREVGSSRSMLAERFNHFVGVPPMQYLARWRMQLAASLLSGTKLSLAQIADRVGYGSEAALSRAFKRCVGLPPARYRQGARGAEKVARRVDFRRSRETLAHGIRSVSSPVGQTA